MIMRVSCALLRAAVLLVSVAGCTTQYELEFRHSGPGSPIANSQVRLSSVPRIYSFLDARHYISETGRVVVVEGRTDEAGRTVLSLPGGLGIRCVQLDGRWFVSELSSIWQPMLTQQEYEAKTANAGMKEDRPLVRMKSK